MLKEQRLHSGYRLAAELSNPFANERWRCVAHGGGGGKRFGALAPLKRVPEASDDGGAVRAGDGLPLGAADVVQNVVASLHGDLHPGRPLCGVQRPRGSCQVLDVHVVFP